MPNRGSLLIGAFVVVLVGTGLGVVAYAAQPVLGGISVTVTDIVPTMTPRPMPTPVATLGAIGSVGRLALVGGAIIWVDEMGLWAWERAHDNRDPKGANLAMDIYDYLSVDASTTVKVTARKGDTMQVEVIGGPMDGRRGWLKSSTLYP